MRESAVEKALTAYAGQNGMLTLKLNGMGDRGKPDRWFGIDGRSLFLEIKRPGEEPEPLQYWWIKRLRAQGFTADWCDSVADGIAIINAFLKP